MNAPRLATDNPLVTLVEPIVERDAALGVAWLEGETGRETLRLMGVPDKDNKPTTLEAEQARVQGFIDGPDRLNWMIQYDGSVIGAVWADMKEREGLAAPSVHIMIGDPAMRGKGIGAAAFGAVLGYLETKGYEVIYSRHLITNDGSKKLLYSLGFTKHGAPYADDDGLEWQNVARRH